MDAKEMKPVKTSDVDLAFPAQVLDIMPKWEDIPKEFRGGGGSSTYADKMFYQGGTIRCTVKDGIDKTDAIRHLRRILGSYEPKHEHKTAAINYLISLWFDKFEFDVGVPSEKKEGT